MGGVSVAWLAASRRASCQSAADGDGFEDGPTHPCSLPAKLAELQLPGGIKISVPEGAFNFSLAMWLASTSNTTVPKRFVFDNLNFESSSMALTPESRPTVDTLAAILKAYPAVSVDLEGYTDSTGDAASNKKLLLYRAAGVKSLLVAGGVADSRITTAGFGPENRSPPTTPKTVGRRTGDSSWSSRRDRTRTALLREDGDAESVSLRASALRVALRPRRPLAQ